MSFREKIEDHVGLAVAGFLVVGFTAGVGTVAFLNEQFGHGADSSCSITCAGIERQVDSMIVAHKVRMAELQARYLEAEQEASSFGHIDQSHQWWAESAQRLGDQIKSQNEAFSMQVQALRQLSTQ